MNLTAEMEKWTPEYEAETLVRYDRDNLEIGGYVDNDALLCREIAKSIREAQSAARKQALNEAAEFAENGVEGWQNGKYFDAVTPEIIAEGIRALISKDEQK